MLLVMSRGSGHTLLRQLMRLAALDGGLRLLLLTRCVIVGVNHYLDDLRPIFADG